MVGVRKLIIILLIFFIPGINPQIAQAQTGVVHAILFFSPSCEYCHQVIDEVLPPLSEKYGDQLEIVGIDVSTEAGSALYESAINYFKIPDERLGMPTMIVGDSVLWGKNEITDDLPEIVANGVNYGGIAWPEIPGLLNLFSAIGYDSTMEAASGHYINQSQPAWKENFARDPVGNSLSVVVLIFMIASVIGVGYYFLIDDRRLKLLDWPKWSFLLLITVGIFVAAYLTYIELTRTDAVCGPVGDCNSVQESRYAYLFGVVPVGLLGLIGYITMLAVWLLHNYGPKNMSKVAIITLWAMAWFGSLFSIYLTFLEPFVIGATCAWCITSAVVMCLLLWATTKPMLDAFNAPEYLDFLGDDQPIGFPVDGVNQEGDIAGSDDII